MRLGLLGGMALCGAVFAAGCGDPGGDGGKLWDGSATGVAPGLNGPGGDGGTSSGTGGDGGTTTGMTGVSTSEPDTTGDGGTTGGDDDGGNGCSLSESAKVTPKPADVVIALDTSGSMATEICSVADNLSDFADGIGPETRVSTVYAFGIGDTFTTLPALVAACGKEDPLQGTNLSMDPERYQNIPANVNSHNALQVLLDQYSAYSGFFRPGSPTHFIVVTDDTSNLDAGTFRNQMEANLGGPFYFHSIVYDGSNAGAVGCGGSVGQQYLDLSAATGGEQLSLCASDWSVLFGQLEAAVEATANLPCSIPIPAPPPGNIFSKDEVSVFFSPPDQDRIEFLKAESAESCGEDAAWYFDDEMDPSTIEFCESGCKLVTESLGDLDIAFGCSPPVLK